MIFTPPYDPTPCEYEEIFIVSKEDIFDALIAGIPQKWPDVKKPKIWNKEGLNRLFVNRKTETFNPNANLFFDIDSLKFKMNHFNSYWEGMIGMYQLRFFREITAIIYQYFKDNGFESECLELQLVLYSLVGSIVLVLLSLFCFSMRPL